ncbi:hypothetical protein ACWERY_02300 [Streptomyces sp. NPDC004082]
MTASWRDVCGDGDDIPPDDDLPDRDLRGQGLTALQLHTITDIEPTGDYL